jgi:AraC-like DNA-binding protein
VVWIESSQQPHQLYVAVRFKAIAGVARLTYLLVWRMRLAERALKEDDVPVAALARSIGYTSESAFSNAFKRFAGTAPNRYRVTARLVDSRESNLKMTETRNRQVHATA